MNTDNKNGNALRRIAVHAELILPAVLLGVLAMVRGGVSPVLWGQQLAAFVVFAALAEPLRRALGRIPDEILSMMLVIPLAAALFGPEAGGARRWIDLGVLNVNAAQLVLPALLVVLCRVKCPYPFMLGACVVLCAQPSFLQLIAFAAASLPILYKKGKRWGIACAALMGVLVLLCARMPVQLEPVPYCEGILTMLGSVSPLLQAVGWAALAAVPLLCLVRFFPQGRRLGAEPVGVLCAVGGVCPHRGLAGLVYGLWPFADCRILFRICLHAGRKDRL